MSRGIRARARTWILRRILRSALIFERTSRGLYETLRDRLGEGAQGGLRHLIEEERAHHALLEQIVEGRLEEEALEGMLAGHRYHALEETSPLSPADLATHGERLDEALRDEEATVAFYRSLERISSIAGVKRAFHVLKEMEREHVEILRRLLGRGGEEVIPGSPSP
jgi:rubrerythrin